MFVEEYEKTDSGEYKATGHYISERKIVKIYFDTVKNCRKGDQVKDRKEWLVEIAYENGCYHTDSDGTISSTWVHTYIQYDIAKKLLLTDKNYK